MNGIAIYKPCVYTKILHDIHKPTTSTGDDAYNDEKSTTLQRRKVNIVPRGGKRLCPPKEKTHTR